MAFPAMVAARLTALADSVANSSSMPYSPMLSSKRLAALSNLSAEAAAASRKKGNASTPWQSRHGGRSFEFSQMLTKVWSIPARASFLLRFFMDSCWAGRSSRRARKILPLIRSLVA